MIFYHGALIPGHRPKTKPKVKFKGSIQKDINTFKVETKDIKPIKKESIPDVIVVDEPIIESKPKEEIITKEDILKFTDTESLEECVVSIEEILEDIPEEYDPIDITDIISETEVNEEIVTAKPKRKKRKYTKRKKKK